MIQRVLFYVSIVMAGALFASCNKSETQQASVPAAQIASNYAGLPDKEQLQKRIEERWDALIKLDMKTVYSFATPTYRSNYDIVHLANQYAGQITRTGIEIEDIDIDSATDTAQVKVTVHSMMKGFEGADPFPISTLSKSTWIKADGLWWHVEPR